MKDFLRSLLMPGKPPPERRPRPVAPQPASNKPVARAPRHAASRAALDERSTGALVRDMLRQKLDDPEYARRFAAGIKALLRRED